MLRRLTLRAWLVLIVVLLAGGAIIYSGNRRSGTPAAQGTLLEGQDRLTAPAGYRVLRLATFNIHGGKGDDGVTDLSRTAALLLPFDVVGLQEIRNPALGDCNTTELGRQTGHAWLFAPSERRWWREHFGNGILSRRPVEAWERRPLVGTQNRGFRNVLVVRMSHDGQTLTILNTHIDRRRDHGPQLQAVRTMFLEAPTPVVLMGDLNTSADHPVLAELLATPGVIDATSPFDTRPDPHPRQRVDWILGRGITVVSGGVHDTIASDHPLVWAEITLNPGQAPVGVIWPDTSDR